MMRRIIYWVSVVVAIPGCGGDSVPVCGSLDSDGVARLTDEGNYRFDGGLDIASQEVAVQIESCLDDTDNDDDGDIDEIDECVDLTIDFSQVTTDLQGHDMNPVDDVDSVALVIFRYLTEEEVEQKLSQNALVQSDVGLYVAAEPGDSTQVQFSELNLLGNDIGPHQYLEEGYGTYMLYLQQGNTIGVGVKMSQFIAPVNGSDVTDVAFTNESTLLEYSVELADVEPLVLPGGTQIEIDWSEVSVDGLGQDFDPSLIDQLMLARYENRSIEELEEQFLDIELVADEIWNATLTGQTSVRLDAAVGDSGVFPGLDETSTYLMALRCSRCANPAPLYLVPLTRCEVTED